MNSIFRKKFNEVHIVAVVTLIFVSFILCVFLPKTYGIFFPEDEFAYWNNAAKLLGIDWRQVAARPESYCDTYAYGYSFLLVPHMLIFKNPLTMYIAAIIINGIMVVLYSVVFYKCVIKLSMLLGYEMNSYGTIIVTLIGVFYPGVLVYMNYTIAEVFIHLLFVALCNVIIEMCNGNETKKFMVLGFALCVCLLVTHYRTIGILVSYMLICEYLLIKDKYSYSTIICAMTAVCVGLMGTIIFYFIGYFSFDKIFTYDAIINLLCGLGGRLYYLGAVTFAFGLVGVFICGRNISNPFFAFIILAYFFTAFISAYYFVGGTRLDQIIYGRYTEMFVPIFMTVGIIFLKKNKESRTIIIAVVAISLLILLVLATTITRYLVNSDLYEYLEFFVSGIDWMYLGQTVTQETMLIRPLIIVVPACIAIVALGYIKAPVNVDIVIVMLVLAVVSIYSGWKHAYYYQGCDEPDYVMAKSVEYKMNNGYELVYLDSPDSNYINLMQFWFKYVPIEVYRGGRNDLLKLKDNSIVITNYESEYNNELNDMFDCVEMSPHFVVFYN